jgi:hypothetical protein
VTGPIIRTLILECEAGNPDLSAPRICNLLAPVSIAERDDCWLADIDPPFAGRNFGSDIDAISRVIIATKWKGYSLFDTHHEIIPVYVARILDGHETSGRAFGADQIRVILWCAAKQMK